jgi:hypothetical protein
MDASCAPRIRVSSSSQAEVRAYLEPWGFDFPIPSGSWLEFEAEEASPEFAFEVSHDGANRHQAGAQSLSVHFRGACGAIVVVAPNGKRDRFA